MKSIIIFRHASTNHATEHQRDYDRTLTPRGIKDAEKMGSYLLEKKSKPDLLLSSSAVRARQTAEIAHTTGNWKSKFFLEPKIYGGNPYFLLDIIKQQEDIYNSICIVGHEPNFSSFIAKLTNTHINFPTASMAKIDFNIEEWIRIDFEIGTLDWLTHPKDLTLNEDL